MSERLERSGIPRRFWYTHEEYNFPPQIGKGLLLVGPAGTGKTHFACATAQAYMSVKPTLKVRFRTMARVLEDQRRVMTLTRLPDAAAEVANLMGELDTLRTVGLLIVDDVAKEHATDWTTSQFDSLLRDRFDAGLRSIITTNLPVQQWGTRYSEAMASFIHEAFEIKPLVREDRRREASAR